MGNTAENVASAMITKQMIKSRAEESNDIQYIFARPLWLTIRAAACGKTSFLHNVTQLQLDASLTSFLYIRKDKITLVIRIFMINFLDRDPPIW